MWDFSENTILKKAVFLIACPFNVRKMSGRRTEFYTLCSKVSLLCLNSSPPMDALACFLVMKISFLVMKKLVLMPTGKTELVKAAGTICSS